MIDKKDALNWFKQSKKELAEAVYSRFESIQDDQCYRDDRGQIYLCMYGNTHDFGLAGNDVEYIDRVQGLTLNVVQIMIDTLASKIGSNQPRPFFLTEAGNWQKREQAQKLNKFVYGQFYQSKTYEKSLKAFLCACVFGDGFLKHYSRDGKIHTDWVLPTEIYADQKEAIYGQPKSLFQVRYVSKDTLQSRFPKFKEEIEAIEPGIDDLTSDHTLSNMVKVVEAWHLPSGKDSGDGKHTICIKGAALFEEEWDKEYFPFSKYQIFDPILGYYGKGVAEALAPIQIEINKTIKRISKAIHLCSVPRTYLERGSKVVKGHLNNEVGAIVEYSGTPPIFDVARSVSPELANHLENLYAKSFEIIGLSQLSAQSKKPGGLNSGKALREYNDIETERFARVAKTWEEFHLDVARHYVALAKELSESSEEKDYSILAHDKEGTELLKWKEVSLEEDSYIMQLYPTSMLPKTPAGRLEYTQELLQAGFIGQEEGLELLDFPDIESVTQFRTANYKMATRIINNFLKGIFLEPDTYHQNALIMPYVQNALTYFETQGLDDEKLDLFRMWIDQAMLLINPPEQQSTEIEAETDAMAEEQMAADGAQVQAMTEGQLPDEGAI